MSRPVALAIGLLLATAATLAGCSGSSSPSPLPSASIGPAVTAGPTLAPTPSPTVSPSPSAPASPVEGVVTKIDATGLDKVNGFTIRTADGASLTFRIGTLENGAEFPPGHLKEHQATSSPVRVFFRPDGSDLVVYRIEDAG